MNKIISYQVQENIATITIDDGKANAVVILKRFNMKQRSQNLREILDEKEDQKCGYFCQPPMQHNIVVPGIFRNAD